MRKNKSTSRKKKAGGTKKIDRRKKVGGRRKKAGVRKKAARRSRVGGGDGPGR